MIIPLVPPRFAVARTAVNVVATHAVQNTFSNGFLASTPKNTMNKKQLGAEVGQHIVALHRAADAQPVDAISQRPLAQVVGETDPPGNELTPREEQFDHRRQHHQRARDAQDAHEPEEARLVVHEHEDAVEARARRDLAPQNGDTLPEQYAGR